MFRRRQALVIGTSAFAAPYFFTLRTAKADELNDGLVNSVRVVSNNLGIQPSGHVGNDIVTGGGTVFGRSTRAQADHMAQNGRFTQVLSSDEHTANVCSNQTGYMFTRFQSNFFNFCAPLGIVASQDISSAYAGAMTLLEGPNFVGLRVLTELLVQRGYTPEQAFDYVWPLEPSSNVIYKRERALISFDSIASETRDGATYIADRDVLIARRARCAIRYTNSNGRPDGGGQGALIVNGEEQFRFEFKYNPKILTGA
jgi:hypothetical protein